MFKPTKINEYLQQLNTSYDESLMLKLKAIRKVEVNLLFTSVDNIYDNPYILWFLHRCYYKGLGVDLNLNLAYKYLKLADSKINNLYFKYDLGVLYEFGMGVEINNELAFQYYNESYNLINDKNNIYLATIYFKLGYFYSNGLGITKDINKGIEFYKLSADLNNHKACYYLAILYYLGNEISQNLNLSFKLFEKSAIISKYTFHRAVYKLGYCYEYGIGTNINYKKAVEIYSKGIRLNCLECIYAYTNLFINKKLEIPKINTLKFNLLK